MLRQVVNPVKTAEENLLLLLFFLVLNGLLPSYAMAPSCDERLTDPRLILRYKK
jgi:hypothetical protein